MHQGNHRSGRHWRPAAVAGRNLLQAPHFDVDLEMLPAPFDRDHIRLISHGALHAGGRLHAVNEPSSTRTEFDERNSCALRIVSLEMVHQPGRLPSRELFLNSRGVTDGST